MYNVDTTIDSESRSVNFIDVGIHEDVELISVEFKVSPNGSEFIVWTFKKDEKTLVYTDYQSRDEDPDKLENKRKNQVVRTKHIVTKYIPEEKYVYKSESFKDFCEYTIKALGNSYVGVKMRLKVIYNNRGYASLPKYVPFLEKMTVPKDQSRLEIISIDRMTRDSVDQETPSTNPLKDLTHSFVDSNEGQNKETTKDEVDNLPF